MVRKQTTRRGGFIGVATIIALGVACTLTIIFSILLLAGVPRLVVAGGLPVVWTVWPFSLTQVLATFGLTSTASAVTLGAYRRLRRQITTSLRGLRKAIVAKDVGDMCRALNRIHDSFVAGIYKENIELLLSLKRIETDGDRLYELQQSGATELEIELQRHLILVRIEYLMDLIDS